MPKINKSIDIHAPVEKVFEYVSDPLSTPEWLVGATEVTGVTGAGVGQRYHWKYNMLGVLLQGETTVREHVLNERRVTESTGGGTSTWTLTFAPYERGTRLALEIDYTIPVPVLGKLAENLILKRNEREADLSMENIKQRMEV